MPFADYVEQHLTGPLDMSRTTFREPTGTVDGMPESLAADVSRGYITVDATRESGEFVYMGHIAPAAGLSATAADMARWMLAHLNEGELDGVRILRADTARRMHTQHSAPHPALPGMAHGFFEMDTHGYRGLGHGGGTVFFISDMRFIPALGLGIYVSTNSSNAGAQVIDGFPEAVVARYFPPGPNILEPVATPATNLSPYLGTYIFSRRAHSTVEKINMPVAIIAENADHEMLLVMGPEPQRFEQVGPHLFQNKTRPDQKIAFTTNEAGAASRLIPWMPILVADRAGVFQQPNNVFGAMGLGVLIFVCVLIGRWLRRKRPTSQSSGESWAARVTYLTSTVWITCIVTYGVSFARIMGDFRNVFFDFPSPLFSTALSLALLGTALTILSVGLLAPVWTHASWPLFRRIRHTLVVMTFVAVLGVFYNLNAIGFNYLP